MAGVNFFKLQTPVITVISSQRKPDLPTAPGGPVTGVRVVELEFSEFEVLTIELFGKCHKLKFETVIFCQRTEGRSGENQIMHHYKTQEEATAGHAFFCEFVALHGKNWKKYPEFRI